MAKYTVLNNETGKRITFNWTGAKPPTETDIRDVFAAAERMPPVAAKGMPSVPTPTAVKPTITPLEPESRMRRVARAAAPYARPALEIGGALAGGALATPGSVLAPGVATLAGAGLGYAGGRRLSRALETYAGLREPEALSQALAGTALDIPAGAALEAGGAVLGVPIQAGIRTAARLFPRRTAEKVIEEGISKAIKPTAVGKETYRGIRRYYDKAKEAVKAIIQNRENLNFVDEFGEQINKLPESLDEFSQAIQNTKDTIFKQYDAIAKGARQYGKPVNMSDIAKELDPIVNSKPLRDFFPNIIRYAGRRAQQLKIADRYTTQEAQDLIKHLNNSLQAYYKNPTVATAGVAQIDAMIANNIRKNLDDVIELSKTFNPGLAKDASYQALKKTYGALREIEKDVSRRTVADLRKSSKELVDFSDILSGGEAVQGILKLDPIKLAKAATMRVVANFIKRSNNPNTIVKKMFSGAEKLLGKAPRGVRPISRLTKFAGPYAAAQPTIEGRERTEDTLAEGFRAATAKPSAEAIVSPATMQWQRAVQAYHAGNYPAAIIAFKRAIKDDPSRAEQFKLAISMIKNEQNALRKRQKKGRE